MTSSTNPLPERFKYQVDTRTDKEIQLSNNLCHVLSDLNLKRITSKAETGDQIDVEQLKSQFYFICLCGLPPFDGEFESLDLSGEKSVLYPDGFKGKYTD